MAQILRLVRRYDDTPMSFADACLVRMAEQTPGAMIFTTDSDFRTYRMNGRQCGIPLMIPVVNRKNLFPRLQS